MPKNTLSFFGDSVHVMSDIETVDNKPGSMIPQIGAVAFRPNDKPGVFLDSFVMWATLVGQDELGLTMSPETIEWWFDQSPEAIKSVFGKHNPKVKLNYALHSLNEFVVKNKAKCLWGHGATFDNVLIDAAFRAAEIRSCVPFRGARDTRTLFDLVAGGDWSSDDEIDMDAYGPKHDGLADAKRQAVVVQRAMVTLRGGR